MLSWHIRVPVIYEKSKELLTSRYLILLYKIEVLVMNSILSLPYYLTLMLYEHKFKDIYGYFIGDHLSTEFIISFGLLLILACLS